MYKELFDTDLQEEMISFYLNTLVKVGEKINYSKGEIIDPENANNIYIVVDGVLKQMLYSCEGKEITLFMLPRGTIYGEMDYFDGHRTCVITKAIKDSIVSVIPRDIVEEELTKNPKMYRYFIHSIARKYRLVMLKIADNIFNNSLGKLASTLLRLTVLQEGKYKNDTIMEYIYSHEELASYLGCSRITITNGLNYFKENNLIDMQNRKIIIKDIDGLKKYIKSIW